MKILKGALLTLAEEGRCTLQVPTYSLNFAGHAEEVEEIPDEWVHQVNYNRVCVGREQGFLFMTRAGYEANRERLRAAFGTRQTRGWTWADFETHAEEHFALVRNCTRKAREALERKLTEMATKETLL